MAQTDDETSILKSRDRAGLGFLDSSISDKSHRSLGRIVARGENDETTETEPFAPVQSQGGAGGFTRLKVTPMPSQSA